MKRKLLALGLIVLTLANVAGLLTMGVRRCRDWCQMAEYGSMDGGREPQDGLRRELGLSEEQAARFTVLREAFQTNLARIRPTLQGKREELAQLLAAPDPDRARIEAVVAEINSLQAELQKQVIQHLLDEKKVLTPAQQQKFLTIIRAKLLEEDSHHQTNRVPSHREGDGH